jgi:hypothetical protein
VCPHCARISYADGRLCPYCARSFRRSHLLPIAAMLTVFAAIVLGGVALMFVAAGNEVDEQLDREVRRVEREMERNFDGIQDDVREELDRRLPEPTPSP